MFIVSTTFRIWPALSKNNDISGNLCLFSLYGSYFFLIYVRKPLKNDAEVQILLDVKDVIKTLGSFKIEAHSVRPIFLPIHSKDVVGSVVLSFRSKSKQLENLFKLRISVKVRCILQSVNSEGSFPVSHLDQDISLLMCTVIRKKESRGAYGTAVSM